MATLMKAPTGRTARRRKTATFHALHEAVMACFAGSPDAGSSRVGVELELLPFRRRWDGVARPVLLEQIAPLVAGVPDVTFEPGGQLELSPPPGSTTADALTHLEQSMGEVERRLQQRGLGLLAAGLDPWHGPDVVGLQLRTPRYVAMQRHFDAIGSSGRLMMLRSAALQVAVDLGRGAAGVEQWRLANLAAPVLAATFANAPVVAGVEQRGNGARTAMWERVDPSRAGSRCVDPSREPIDAYMDLTLRAEALPLSRAEGEALPFRQPFGTWLQSGGARPDAEDVAHHLSTLFPPVRARGAYLEIRVLDSLPRPHRAVAVPVVALLLSDPAARGGALAMLEHGDAGRRWEAAAGSGVHDTDLRRDACALLALAAAAAGRAAPGAVPHGTAEAIDRFAARYTAQGNAPGDDVRGTMAWT